MAETPDGAFAKSWNIPIRVLESPGIYLAVNAQVSGLRPSGLRRIRATAQATMIHEQSMPLTICCLAVLLITPQVLDRALVDPATAAQSRCADCAGSSGPDAARRGQPLWPGARFTEEDRARAIRRGLDFIYRSARKPSNFASRGQDYLWCFDTTAKAFKDPAIRSAAQCMGVERANEWRRLHCSVPRGASRYGCDSGLWQQGRRRPGCL
jgi:hypothetical protein